MTETAAEMVERALQARMARRFPEALDLAQAALSHPDGGLGRKQRRAAYVLALGLATRIGAWATVEALALDSLAEYPDHPYFLQCLGEARMQDGRIEEAEAALTRALELNPEQDGARALLAALHTWRPGQAKAPRPRPWPPMVSEFQDPRHLIRRYLLRYRPKSPFIRPDTVFMTLGSCFAQNLALRLRTAGYSTHSEEIGEEVNSTYANRHLLDWVQHGPVNGPTRVMHQAYGAGSRERLLKGLTSSDVFVMTLGVAPCFFDPDGEFVFLSPRSATTNALRYAMTMRTTSVAENVDNIEAIIASVRRMAGRDIRIVLTVSPVPLQGTTEHESAITADCLSKSTLRVACQEVVTAHEGDGVIYWPSFEIVRWLGPYFGPDLPRVYGAEDGRSGHVSEWIIDLIVADFLDFNAAPAPA